MSERKLAPHVARAIGAAQAKPAGARPPLPVRPATPAPPAPTRAAAAPHLTAAVGAARLPAARAAVQASSAAGPGAPHVRAALAAARQPPQAPARPARTAGAPPAQPKPAPARLPQAASHVPRAGASIQPYRVLGPDKIWTVMPTKRPWLGYPYVLLGDVALAAQERGDQEDESGYLGYLDHTAKVIHRKNGRSIRLSDDNRMAIEHSDLTRRQPKAFFLAQAVLDTANQRLAQIHSPIRLAETGKTITAITGWSSQTTLKEVTPRFNDDSSDELPQNCNAMAGVVMGVGALSLGETLPLKTMLRLLGRDENSGILTAEDLRGYARGNLARQLQQGNLNQHANPGIGEAFMIGSTTNVTELYDEAERTQDDDEKQRLFMALQNRDTFRDYFDQKDKKLNWPYHYGAVVAISGADRITLENYARGDNRQNQADPRWFFQMYGTQAGQSFHEANRGDSYVNPLTMVIRRQN
jgi:hypothetical protein